MRHISVLCTGPLLYGRGGPMSGACVYVLYWVVYHGRALIERASCLPCIGVGGKWCLDMILKFDHINRSGAVAVKTIPETVARADVASGKDTSNQLKRTSRGHLASHEPSVTNHRSRTIGHEPSHERRLSTPGCIPRPRTSLSSTRSTPGFPRPGGQKPSLPSKFDELCSVPVVHSRMKPH